MTHCVFYFLFWNEESRNEVQLPELVPVPNYKMKSLHLVGQSSASTVILRKFEERLCEQISHGIAETFYFTHLGCFAK